MFRWRQNSHQYLHLSDGGHFENLGLYELIRRHCRYIIISDCGADPTYSFDDLANAIRRVREDFGVEIEVDLDPIRPNKDGVAQQHLAVGVIHYDGVAGCDKGTLLLFTPVMTGNEPCDVLQYRNANQVFPQEGTGDQFYDEAQWESYHRLGEHSGHEAFRFIDDVPNRRIGSVEALFHLALERWQAGWPQQSEQFVALTERFSKLEAQVRDHAPTFLQAEFFPEVARVCPGMGQPKHEEQVKAVYFVMLVLQFMEDVWLAGKLDTQWSHPLNQGWMSYMHRWASTPSFQRWWPILKPLYSTSFRDFIRRRFGLKLKDISRQGTEAPVHSNDARLRLEPMSIAQAQKGFAWQEWTRTQSPPIPASGFMTFSYELLFPSPPEVPAPIPLQVGVAFVQIDPVAQVASWSTNQFYVPPSLEGAGFVGRFLDALIEHFRSDPKVSELRVTVLDIGQQNHAEPRPDPGSRARRRQIVDFYKSRRFSFDRTASGQTSEFNQLFRKLGR